MKKVNQSCLVCYLKFTDRQANDYSFANAKVTHDCKIVENIVCKKGNQDQNCFHLVIIPKVGYSKYYCDSQVFELAWNGLCCLTHLLLDCKLQQCDNCEHTYNGFGISRVEIFMGSNSFLNIFPFVPHPHHALFVYPLSEHYNCLFIAIFELQLVVIIPHCLHQNLLWDGIFFKVFGF